MKKELKMLLWMLAIFAGMYTMPIEGVRFQGALIEAAKLVKW